MKLRSLVAALAIVCDGSMPLAHDWYPVSCCGGRDCVEAWSVQSVPGGRRVFSKAGIVFVPDTKMPLLQTHDGKTHICVNPGPRDWKDCGDSCKQGFNNGRPFMPYVDPQLICVIDPAFN